MRYWSASFRNASPFQVPPTTSSFADHLLVAAYASILHVFAAPTLLPPNTSNMNGWGIIMNHHLTTLLDTFRHRATWCQRVLKSFMVLFQWWREAPEFHTLKNVYALTCGLGNGCIRSQSSLHITLNLAICSLLLSQPNGKDRLQLPPMSLSSPLCCSFAAASSASCHAHSSPSTI